MTQEISIKCRGISKHYGEGDSRINALKDINLDIHHGELTLLVGPSGSGKSTLLSIITTILTPDKGELFLLDHDVNKMSDNEKADFCRNNLGIVFQSLFLIPTLTVAENVEMPLLIGGHTKEEARDRAMTTLKKMNIAHRSEGSPAILSKGQQQRVAIARAMVNDAKIIVCDEPTSALDQTSGQDTMALLHEIAKQGSRTVLVVTHDHRIYQYAERIININDGKII